MPLQAVALKKNRGATSPISSISDKEHATAPLRNSKPLRVQHAPLDHPVWAGSSANLTPPFVGNAELASSQCPNHSGKVSP